MTVLSPDVSGPVDLGESVDLQCWVQTQNTQCFEEHVVWWFRTGLDQSGPALVYTQRNSSGQCDRSTEGPAPHKCLYTFSKSMSRSDAGTYHCAVAACGLMLFGNGTNVTVKGPSESDMTVLSPDVSGPVDSGDSVDLQCWVQTQNTQCFEEHMVWWFRSGLDQSGPALVYTQRNSSGQCDRSTEGPAPHKCLYTFSKSMSPSDAGLTTVLWQPVDSCSLEMEPTSLSKKVNKCNQSQDQPKTKVRIKESDCEAALHRMIKAAETESVYTYVTFVHVK
ncbi:hypothetical protein WMY93_032068 [Mugilogobius chulae]|uniref:Ig-like domain-containing protein n=1 Tax=Mugilogobius chulae TaxID=88201 RepID=A0AAW0MDK3_9GOBI